jgi:hypothetical protein
MEITDPIQLFDLGFMPSDLPTNVLKDGIDQMSPIGWNEEYKSWACAAVMYGGPMFLLGVRIFLSENKEFVITLADTGH